MILTLQVHFLSQGYQCALRVRENAFASTFFFFRPHINEESKMHIFQITLQRRYFAKCLLRILAWSVNEHFVDADVTSLRRPQFEKGKMIFNVADARDSSSLNTCRLHKKQQKAKRGHWLLCFSVSERLSDFVLTAPLDLEKY